MISVKLPIFFEDMETKYAAGVTGKYLIVTDPEDKRKGYIILERTQPNMTKDDEEKEGGND